MVWLKSALENIAMANIRIYIPAIRINLPHDDVGEQLPAKTVCSCGASPRKGGVLLLWCSIHISMQWWAFIFVPLPATGVISRCGDPRGRGMLEIFKADVKGKHSYEARKNKSGCSCPPNSSQKRG